MPKDLSNSLSEGDIENIRIYEIQWDWFTREWDVYKGTVAIIPDKLPVYLACYDLDLKLNVEKSDLRIISLSEAAVLAAMKRHAAICIAGYELRM